jgi:transposase
MSAFTKKTKSRNGATVIQVVFKNGRKVTKLVHVGTAHSAAEEEELRSVAQDIIHEGQMALDLFEAEPTGLDLVLESTYSATLWQALTYIYESLGFDALGDETFKELVIARIIEPTSKLDTIRVIDDLGLNAPTNSQIHRTLAKVREDDYRATLSSACFEYASASQLSLLLYDVTTLYFEIQKEDGFRKPGMSKERRLEPQITVGLLVGRDGFPLEVQSFEGNRAEVKTIMEVLDTFKTRHGIDDLTVTADAAMLSSKNVQALEDMGYHYIIGSRIAKTPYEIAEYAKVPGQELEDNQIFDLKVDMNTGKGDKRIKRRVIYQYRKKRASMDLMNIDKLLAKAERMVAGQTELKRNRFVTIKGAKKEINYNLVAESRLKAGIKGYVTDLDIAPEEVIDAYHQLFQVERSFRMSKSDLKARPIFHHKKDSIEAHLTIVFAALAISRVIQTKTGISIKRFLNTLKPVRTGRLSIAGKMRTIQPRVPAEARELLNKLYS